MNRPFQMNLGSSMCRARNHALPPVGRGATTAPMLLPRWLAAGWGQPALPYKRWECPVAPMCRWAEEHFSKKG